MAKKKLVLGMGKTGISCINFLNKKDIGFKVFDTREKQFIDISNCDNQNFLNYRFCDFEDDFLEDIDEAIISPGLNLEHKIINRIRALSIPIITDIELWSRYSDTPIIAVTGTNGKTTTVSMLEHLLNNLKIDSLACGNNGIPILESLNKQYEYLIVELSSYQLENIKNIKTLASLITNVEEDHLERHKEYQNYLSIKKRIFMDCEYALCNINLKNSMGDIQNCKFFGIEKNKNNFIINNRYNTKLLLRDENVIYGDLKIPFKGLHNINNLLAVLSVADNLGIKIDKSLQILSTFIYPDHRIQFIKKNRDILWYNDSKSTNVSSTIAALEYTKKNTLLILGGSEKSLDYQKLNPYIKEKVKMLIFIGENRNLIKNQLKTNIPMIDARSISDAVAIADRNALSGDTVLLSPASPSFDMFVNYEERGIEFIKAVNNIVK